MLRQARPQCPECARREDTVGCDFCRLSGGLPRCSRRTRRLSPVGDEAGGLYTASKWKRRCRESGAIGSRKRANANAKSENASAHVRLCTPICCLEPPPAMRELAYSQPRRIYRKARQMTASQAKKMGGSSYS